MPDNPGYSGVPADYSVLNYKPYSVEPFSFGVVTGSGCDYRCNYCDIPHLTSKKYQTRDVEDVNSHLVF